MLDDFLGSAADGVHGLHPQHLVGRFQGFVHALGFRHLLNDETASFRCLLVQIGKVGVQLAGENEFVVKTGTVHPQVGLMQPAPMPDRAFFLRQLSSCEIKK